MSDSAFRRAASRSAPSLPMPDRTSAHSRSGRRGRGASRWSPPAACAPPLLLTRDGYFSGAIDARAGDRYQFKIDGDERLYPDPASRFQPEGPHGPSRDRRPGRVSRGPTPRGAGVRRDGQVIYEMHVGTFTREGTWAAAAAQLARAGAHRHHADRGDAGRRVRRALRLGLRRRRSVRAVAPLRRARRLPRGSSTRAHAAGVGVILDVVYNHLGPAGNYLRAVFRPPTSPNRYENEWGDAINFDGPDAGRCASSSSPTPATGSRSFISTACGSTRRSRSSTTRPSTSCAAIGAARARRRRRRARS